MSKEELEEVRDAVVAHLPVGLGQRIPRVVHQGHVILGDAFQSGQVRVKLDYLTLGLHERERGFLPGIRRESDMHSI